MPDASGHLSGEFHSKRPERSSVIRVTSSCFSSIGKKSFCLCVIPFSEGVACPDVHWLKKACGKRGRCLLDPNVNGFRDCKCLPGHYYDHYSIAECVGTESNIPCFITKPGFQRVIPCRITSVNSQSSANQKNYLSM